ncbi:DUF924 family protein [Marivita sp. XM-24bin2]|jgi:uncharacterized protein (DUF924 family)|uniref:DUF924 family protein n=1 Tax=unclassified Marivita TaxID=2632480 RepID=UPI000D7A3865|nr:DUF924 family protein [Marivita sp. XM-24bin2]MCR9110512.1 DUF924 domain-containing protein [Paracoccaceae bacterium]PWL35234.1 MAG: DUF924 domain-containing protein [Marivita sp. XM-24bin2]
MVTPEEVLSFWIDDVGPDGWYKSDEALDQEIRDRFAEGWAGAMEGRHALWLTYPSGTLAYIVLMDQFPRNMFRGSAKAFASDRFALAAAKQAIGKNWDLKIDEPVRQFFYLPLMHSENLCDQDRCVRLMLERMPEHGASNLLHARAHREVIRKFGRFPYRNTALGRHSTVTELSYVTGGGYGSTVEELKKAG